MTITWIKHLSHLLPAIMKVLLLRIRRQSAMTHYNSMNVLSMHALIGAYMPEGHQWVDELCAASCLAFPYL